MSRNRVFVVLLVVGWSLIGSAAARADDSLLDESAGVERIVSDCKFTEGPVVDREGNLLFSDGANDRIMRVGTDGKLSVFRQPCGRANGLTIDRDGRLVMCQSSGPQGGRKVTRLEKDGSETVLAEAFDGQALNAPNDLCVDPQGRVFFTDPAGLGTDNTGTKSSVYRIDAPGKLVRIIDNLGKPNGIVLTPDGRTLYVSDRGSQKLHRYKVDDKGDVTADGVVYEFAPDRGIDGMRLDERGNIWAAAGQDKTTGLFVVSPEGKLLLHKPMPEFSTNLCFGGPDGKTIYFTATTSVYRLKAKVVGAGWGKK
jgi:gluconolactonase